MSTSRQLATTAPRSGSLATRQDHLPANNDRLDIASSLGFFRRRGSLILAFIAATIAAAVAYSIFAEKEYRAQTTVMIEQHADGVDAVTRTAAAQQPITGQIVETQLEIITSREMAASVAASLGLTAGMTDDEKRELIDTMVENVRAERTGESFAIAISFDANDPRLAAQVANQFARNYVDWEMIADKERNSAEQEEVNSRLAELRAQAQADTQALQQYRIANNLLSTSGATLTEQEIANFNFEATKARALAAEDQARLRTALSQLKSGSTGDDVGEALGSPVVASLRTQEAELARQVANMSARYGPNHPQLIRTENELSELRGQIQAEIGRVISNLQAKSEVSSQRLASLNSSVASARAKLSDNNAAMVQLTDLERAAEASQGIYETYLNRYKQLVAAEGTEKPGARVLTVAEVPLKPFSPNLKLNLALASIIGLGLGLIAAYIADAMSHGISNGEEVERDLDENFLASIPLLQSVNRATPHAVQAIRENPRSAFSESFRALGASIDQAAQGRPKVIAITSALPNEGKTVMSCCLANVFASGGERTMLIDCDLRRRGITRLLDLKADHQGLIEILTGEAPLDLEKMVGDRKFCVLPLSRMEEEPEHLLTGDAFVELLDKLRDHFDRIILDLPPVLPMASTRKIASHADAVVLAAHWRKTSSHAIRAARKRMPQELVNVVGVALNQVDMRKKAYLNQSDADYYYGRYKEYYA